MREQILLSSLIESDATACHLEQSEAASKDLVFKLIHIMESI